MSMSRNRCRIRILANAIYATHASSLVYDASVTVFDEFLELKVPRIVDR